MSVRKKFCTRFTKKQKDLSSEESMEPKKEEKPKLPLVTPPKLKKTVHKIMLKYYSNPFYETIDIINKILTKLKLPNTSNEKRKIRRLINTWIDTNATPEEDGDGDEEKNNGSTDKKKASDDSKKGILPNTDCKKALWAKISNDNPEKDRTKETTETLIDFTIDNEKEVEEEAKNDSSSLLTVEKSNKDITIDVLTQFIIKNKKKIDSFLKNEIENQMDNQPEIIDLREEEEEEKEKKKEVKIEVKVEPECIDIVDDDDEPEDKKFELQTPVQAPQVTTSYSLTDQNSFTNTQNQENDAYLMQNAHYWMWYQHQLWYNQWYYNSTAPFQHYNQSLPHDYYQQYHNFQ